MFSLWPLAQNFSTLRNISIQDQRVEDLMEQLPVVAVSDSLDVVLEQLDRYDAVLVQSR